MRTSSFLVLTVALSMACGSDFATADSTDAAGSVAPDASGIGSGGAAGSVGSGGSGGSGGSTGVSGSGIAAESGTVTPEAGVITRDAKPDVPSVALDAGPTVDASGSPCLTSQDCHNGLVCLFDVKGGCSVMGACMKGVDPTKPICNAISNSCSCSGQTVNVICNGLPNGYYSERIAHTGAC